MSRRRWKQGDPKFIQVFHYQYDSQSLLELTPTAFRVFMEFKRAYNGFNHDELVVTYAELKKKYGFSPSTTSKAFAELVEHGLIDKVAHGGLRVGMKTRQCNKFRFSDRWKNWRKADGNSTARSGPN